MNNDNVKLDIIPQLEVILRSINKDNQDVLNPILDSDEIDKVEKQEIRKYLKLYDVLEGNNLGVQVASGRCQSQIERPGKEGLRADG